MKIRIADRLLPFVSAVALLSGCAGTLQPRSEVPVSDQQIAGLRTGIDRQQLLATLGPPADEQVYRNLNQNVLSWRFLEPGGQHWLFNAHLDPSGRVMAYSRTPDPAEGQGGRMN